MGASTYLKKGLQNKRQDLVTLKRHRYIIILADLKTVDIVGILVFLAQGAELSRLCLLEMNLGYHYQLLRRNTSKIRTIQKGNVIYASDRVFLLFEEEVWVADGLPGNPHNKP